MVLIVGPQLLYLVVSEISAHSLAADAPNAATRLSPLLERRITPRSAALLGQQNAAGTYGVVQARAPFLLPWFGIGSIAVAHQTRYRIVTPPRNTRTPRSHSSSLNSSAV